MFRSRSSLPRLKKYCRRGMSHVGSRRGPSDSEALIEPHGEWVWGPKHSMGSTLGEEVCRGPGDLSLGPCRSNRTYRAMVQCRQPERV